MQSSVGASLKVKYACEHGKVTDEGVIYAIKKEIEDEDYIDYLLLTAVRSIRAKRHELNEVALTEHRANRIRAQCDLSCPHCKAQHTPDTSCIVSLHFRFLLW